MPTSTQDEAFIEAFAKGSHPSFRTFHLKYEDGKLVIRLSDFDKMFFEVLDWVFGSEPDQSDIRHSPCVYRKLKRGHSGDEVRPVSCVS
jgi:hypothetical protein